MYKQQLLQYDCLARVFVYFSHLKQPQMGLQNLRAYDTLKSELAQRIFWMLIHPLLLKATLVQFLSCSRSFRGLVVAESILSFWVPLGGRELRICKDEKRKELGEERGMKVEVFPEDGEREKMRERKEKK